MMNWIRSSKGTIAIALFVVLLGAVGTAAALTVSADDPAREAQVGTEINTTVTIDDAFTENGQWTVGAETELQNVSWQLEEYDQGSRVERWNDLGGQSISQQVSSDPEGDELRVQIRGEVPAVPEYNYSNPSAENVTFVAVTSTTGDNTQTLATYEVHVYTKDSKDAREAIDSAREASDGAGNPDEVESTIDSAISSYNNGNFGNAMDLAEDAESSATSSQQTSQLLMFGAVAVVAIAVIGGGVYYWRNRGDDYDKLR
ncbi:hypothetical protein [Halorientalis halophila]|uniref:hypothetical protein n=1 Tax=Halorientalis halophila TaxID=3108499 RepID=UPI003008F303